MNYEVFRVNNNQPAIYITTIDMLEVGKMG